MNPQFLALALDTPLEDLLGLPNGVEIAYSLRSDLAHYSAAELHDALTAIDALIAAEQQTFRSIPGVDDEDVQSSRELNRDIDWLDDAIRFQPLPRLKDGSVIGAQDLYRVLALYKLGTAIDAAQGSDNAQFSKTVVEALLDATKAMMMAKSPVETWEQALAKAWHAGITPATKVEAEVKKAQSQAGKKAADARHAANRAAKKKALELFFSNDYRTQEEAYRIIGAQVCRAPGTVRNWILAAKKSRSKTKSGDR
jgi:hypothetical protein